MMRNSMLAGLVVAAMPFAAQASKMAMPMECSMKENVTINVQFNFAATSFKDAKAKFDAQSTKIMEFAKQQQIPNLEVQGQNYNIYSNNAGGMDDSYNMNGNMTYKLDNSETAFKFADFLNSQKLKVNINSNTYRQGNCTMPAAGNQ